MVEKVNGKSYSQKSFIIDVWYDLKHFSAYTSTKEATCWRLKRLVILKISELISGEKSEDFILVKVYAARLQHSKAYSEILVTTVA